MNLTRGVAPTSRLTRISTPVLFLGVFFLTVLKSGVPAGGKQPVVWDPDTFPSPVNAGNLNSTFGLRTVGYLLRLENESGYLVAAMVATCLCLLLTALAIVKSPWGSAESRRVVLVVVVGGPFTWTILREYHGVDPWVLAGSVLVASLAWGRVGLVGGVCLMLLGNPEQSLVAFAALTIASFLRPFQAWRKRALAGLVASVVAVLVLTAWTSQLNEDNRLSILWDTVVTGSGFFVSWGYLGLYAGLGLTPILAVVVWRRDMRAHGALLLLLAFLLPIFFTMITLDQSRVLVGTSTLLATAVAFVAVPLVLRWLSDRSLDGPLAITVVVLLLPVVHVEYPSVVRPPLLIISETLGGLI